MGVMAVVILAGAAVQAMAEADNAPPLPVADPEAATGLEGQEPTQVVVIAGRVKPGIPLALQRKSPR